MAIVSYPAQLPTPQSMTVQPTERRQSPAADRPRAARALQRERTRVESVTFPPFDAAEAAVFRAWWRDDLIFGGAWFTATWPGMPGPTAVTRRFVGPPSWSYIGLGRWRVSATIETRDGPPPVAPTALGTITMDAVLNAGASPGAALYQSFSLDPAAAHWIEFVSGAISEDSGANWLTFTSVSYDLSGTFDGNVGGSVFRGTAGAAFADTVGQRYYLPDGTTHVRFYIQDVVIVDNLGSVVFKLWSL